MIRICILLIKSTAVVLYTNSKEIEINRLLMYQVTTFIKEEQLKYFALQFWVQTY